MLQTRSTPKAFANFSLCGTSNFACFTPSSTPQAFANFSLCGISNFACFRPSSTPQAFANFSPELERSDNSGIQYLEQAFTLKEFLPH